MKNKIIIGILSLLTISGFTSTLLVYNDLHSQVSENDSRIVETLEKLEETQDIIGSLEDDFLLSDEEKTSLNEQIDTLGEEIETISSTKEELETKNTEMESYIEEIFEIPNWDPNNIEQVSNVSELGLQMSLMDTGLEGLESSFIEAEKEYGINAIFLSSLVAQESGWGNSRRALDQNNLSGFAVYSDTATGKTFSSKHESIMETAKLLREDYVDDGRKDIYSINKRYSEDQDWDTKIISIASRIIDDSNINSYIERKEF